MRDSNIGKGKEAQVFNPDENLRGLFTEAYRRYRKEVIDGGMDYSRYVDDFIYSHLFISATSTDEGNAISENLSRIDILLKNRRDLVTKYFSCPTFGPMDFMAMYGEFNRSENVPVAAPVSSMNFGCDLSDNTISALVSVANDFRIFSSPVSDDDLRRLFSANPNIRLVSGNNRKLAVFFYTLAENGMIDGDWQRVIAATGAISSSAGSPLSQSKLSSALAAARTDKTATFDTIRKRVREIAASQ